MYTRIVPLSPDNQLLAVRPRPGRSATASRVPFHLVLPGVMVAGVMLLPLLYLAIRALGATPSSVVALLHPRMIPILVRSLLLAASVTLSCNLIAVPLAWLTVRADLPGRRAWAVLTALPLVIPSYVGAFALVAALGSRGLVQQMGGARAAGWALSVIYGFPGAWLTLTLLAFPLILLNVRSTLRQLDPALEEAARSLGDSPGEVFRKITLPLLLPPIASGSILTALYVLGDFGAVSMLRYTTFTRAIYVQYNASFDRSLAALLAVILIAITGILLALESRVQRLRLAPSRATSIRKPPLTPLGVWRWPALLFCVLIVLLSLGVPLAVIILWLWRGVTSGEHIQLTLGPVWRSTLVSAGASGLALLGALPVALLIVRHPGLFSRLVERSSYIGHALPGIVVALSLAFWGANLVTPLYQTIFLLMFAYVVRFMPEAVGAVRSAVTRVSPRIEEAARGLGSRTPRVLFTVIIPLVRPGLLSGGALVFLTSMKELPATLLLAPIGYDTLATRVWSATAEAFYARAAVPALLLLITSALSMGLILASDAVRGD